MSDKLQFVGFFDYSPLSQGMSDKLQFVDFFDYSLLSQGMFDKLQFVDFFDYSRFRKACPTNFSLSISLITVRFRKDIDKLKFGP